MLRFILAPLLLLAFTGACVTPPVASPDFPAASWQLNDGSDEDYLLWPGDTVEISVTTAPELSRMVTINPDGQFHLPLVGAVPAGGRSVDEIKATLVFALSGELRDPRVGVFPTTFASQRVFVGGAVGQPGTIDLPGQIGPFQAIIMAGGFTDLSNSKQVLLIRRIPGGEVKSALIDIRAGIQNPALANWGPIQRFDAIYVSKSWIAQQNQFVEQYIRNALPVDFSLGLDLADSALF